MRMLPCGESGLLVELDDLDAVLGLHAALREDPPPGMVELVPAARTIFVSFDPAVTGAGTQATQVRDRPTLRQRPADREPADGEPADGEPIDREPIELPVHYDGADLTRVGELTGLAVEEIVVRHLAPTYTVAFCGFAPGFAYLTGLDPALQVPRREHPRTRIPAGSVGLAGEFTGAYPRAGPGGWQLIGHTPLVLWDERRDPPALLHPGGAVRFVRAGR